MALRNVPGGLGGGGGQAGGGMAGEHDDFELVLSRERYRDLKVADREHDAASIDGRVGELADLTSIQVDVEELRTERGFWISARGCRSWPWPVTARRRRAGTPGGNPPRGPQWLARARLELPTAAGVQLAASCSGAPWCPGTLPMLWARGY